jgi:chromate transporter
VFGSGLAIVHFLYGGVVQEYHWLTDRQFVDAVAVAMITPGPVVITTGFIGYLVAGFWGSVVAAAGTFIPCYLFAILPAPYFKKHGKRPGIVAFVDGVTAAAIGAITGAVIVIGQRSITDLATAAMALITVGVLWRFKKLPEPVVVVVAALAGAGALPVDAPRLIGSHAFKQSLNCANNDPRDGGGPLGLLCRGVGILAGPFSRRIVQGTEGRADHGRREREIHHR